MIQQFVLKIKFKENMLQRLKQYKETESESEVDELVWKKKTKQSIKPLKYSDEDPNSNIHGKFEGDDDFDEDDSEDGDEEELIGDEDSLFGDVTDNLNF